ncbi:hypothetical protein AMATHDRAFT_173404 [Amanita thiersii Skay4041]|uniref:Blue (type 1) copper domain-containing protein n=1 Tax=Amanita thiersii Skay4041 TaxID=703135 RepID=A0A2A9NQK8_9AGAR|nr:hypothetical protein AMATHDRAFT_173404 [Amanita thiersii Skay4041]
MLRNILPLCLLPILVSAQYGYNTDSSPTPTGSSVKAAPSAPPDTTGQINVDVFFQGNYTFHPNNFTAPKGTNVTFYIPNSGFDHSVTQSSFASPCTHLTSADNSTVGFDSGLTSAKQFTITITDDTKPIWFHCKQVQHCGLGMVGAINAPTTGNNTFEAFMAAALAIGMNEPMEPDNGFVSGGVNAVATAPAVATAGASSSSNGGFTNIPTHVGILVLSALMAIMMM